MREMRLVSRSEMESIPWWNSLDAAQRRAVLIETQSLTEEMERHGLSKLAIGAHLLRLRDILEPKRKFCDYLRRHFPACSQATAYRWINNYLAAKDSLPDSFLRTAMSQGYHVIDATAVEKLPPPKTHDRTKITAYLARLKAARKEERAGASDADTDPELLLRESFHFISTRMSRLPRKGSVQAKWMASLIGMLLSEIGDAEEQSFRPVVVPKGFRVVRGRPKKQV